MADTDPRVLGDRYEIHRRLARGGMAQVYLARDRSLDRPVAVKELVPEFATDPSFVERFRREAQAAANLAHPNIVGVYDWGTQDGTYFIVMEYVDGPSLSQVIRRDGPLHPRRAAELASEVAAALGFAHSRGVVHRDVKPGNVLLTGSGQAKVTDFGIARALASSEEDLTQVGSVMGTATYFSPEQAQGLPVDPRSDLYSLGVVLYEMVTGRTPFTGDTPLAIAYKHVQDPPPPPSTVITDLPVGIDAIIMKLLQKRPEDRYSSAEELRADLRRFLQGDQTSAERALGGAALAGAAVGAASVPAGATMVQPATVAGGAVVPPDDLSALPDEEDRKSRTWLFLGLTLLLLALVGGALWWFARGVDGEKVAVPQLVGLTQAEAEKQLAADQLKADVSQVTSDTVEAGKVISQDPAAGQKVEKDSKVKIAVSTGKPKVKVPNLIGMSQQDAQAALASVGLVPTFDSVESDTAQPGTVVAQNPAADAEVTKDTPVAVTLSKGAGQEIVPDVTGQSLSAAQTNLQAKGFKIGGPQQKASATVPAGQVISTDPAGGTSARKGSTVTVVVSSGPEQVSVPNVVNRTEADATATLQGRGFEVAVSTKSVPGGDPSVGRVISQDPAGGTTSTSGATVKVVVGVASATTSSTSSTSTSTTSP